MTNIEDNVINLINITQQSIIDEFNLIFLRCLEKASMQK